MEVKVEWKLACVCVFAITKLEDTYYNMGEMMSTTAADCRPNHKHQGTSNLKFVSSRLVINTVTCM